MYQHTCTIITHECLYASDTPTSIYLASALSSHTHTHIFRVRAITAKLAHTTVAIIVISIIIIVSNNIPRVAAVYTLDATHKHTHTHKPIKT